jgi:hypothetical protein
MATSLKLMMIRRYPGELPRVTTLCITDEVSSEVQAVFAALNAGDPSHREVTDIIDSEEDGAAVPVTALTGLEFVDPLNTLNGIEVNGSTYTLVKEAVADIESKLFEGYDVELFLQA